jgi:hypothetical protein
MEGLRRDSQLARSVVGTGALDNEPFVLVDVGCSGGVDPGWRSYGDRLVAFGFDPNQSEVDRLRAAETNPNVTYIPAFVGLRADHPFLLSGGSDYWSRNPWDRLSTKWAGDLLRDQLDPAAARRANLWEGDKSVDGSALVVLPNFLDTHGVEHVDFVKIDVDGADLAVLVSLQDDLDRFGVLGVGIEVNFFGSARPTDNTLHNVDRLLKSRGFELFDLSLRRYSTSALPARFISDVPGPTGSGRILQGDALYLRDVANPEIAAGYDLKPAQLLKLCCIFELGGMPDAAAELLVARRTELNRLVDVDGLLQQLTPTSDTYPRYIERFEAADRYFYPYGKMRAAVRALPGPLRERLMRSTVGQRARRLLRH